MGKPFEPGVVRYFASVLSADFDLLDSVGEVIADRLGPILSVTAKHPWDYSPAYTKELGGPIQRRLFVFECLDRPDVLPDRKLLSNELEKALAATRFSGRRVNIDPGYVSGTQVILASTKRYANRVYLRDGVYADLTLFFDGVRFRPFSRFTFPEYRTRWAVQFFGDVRAKYLTALRAFKAPSTKEQESQAEAI